MPQPSLSDTAFNAQTISEAIAQYVGDQNTTLGTIITNLANNYAQLQTDIETNLKADSTFISNIAQQVSELNNYVLNYCIPKVYSEAVAYLRVSKDIYLKDYILYQSEDAEFISREQIQKNFNLHPIKKFDNLNLHEEE